MKVQKKMVALSLSFNALFFCTVHFKRGISRIGVTASGKSMAKLLSKGDHTNPSNLANT